MSLAPTLAFLLEVALFLLAISPSDSLSTITPIIACTSSIELSRAYTYFGHQGDSVLEFGSQFSTATQALCDNVLPGGHIVLLDITRSDSKSGRCNYRDIDAFQSLPGVETMELVSLDDWKSHSGLVSKTTFDIISVDLCHLIGNDLYLSTLSLVGDLVSAFQPRMLLVRSQTLSSLARRLLPAQHVLEGRTPLKEDNLHRSNHPYILAAVGVEEYRRLIPLTIRDGDDVLEVGCHFGRTTALLKEAACNTTSTAGSCLGVDIGPKIIGRAITKYPYVDFAVADAWKTLDLVKLSMQRNPQHQEENSNTIGYDVVFADIGGLSGAHGMLEALSLIDSLANSLEPRCVVVKSLCMKRLASRLKSFTSIWAMIDE